MSATANTPIFAKRANIQVYTQADTKSNLLLFATDTKNTSRDWQTGDSIGNATGIVQNTNEGVFVEVITRQWVKQKLSNNTPKGLFFIPGVNVIAAAVTSTASEWIRVETKAYVKEGDYYTNDQRAENERATIERRAVEAYDTLGTEYQAQEIYKNDAGVWTLKFANGYRIALEDYEKLSLIEKRNIAVNVKNLQSGITVGDPSTTPQKSSFPAWAIGGLIALGVGFLGFLGYTLTKPSKNGKSKKR